ncbi:MAG: AAA domain-containing protein, partial [Aurantimicrobium sp.]
DSRVLGGTAWDFADLNRFPEDTFDLLVVDEAGQFSLANLIATSVSAKRVLLLGDPQQSPQVTTGTHAEPVDVSALGWLSEGHDVLPSELGVFLPESWRMSPELCATVSELSYDNKLHSVTGEGAPRRVLENTSPGLHYIPVNHQGRTLWSPEEAERVVLLVEELIGREWTDSANAKYVTGNPLEQEEIIVVAAYNAQVDLIEEALNNAGYSQVRVGTVD